MDVISVLEHTSMSVPGGDNRPKGIHLGQLDRLSTGVRPTLSRAMIVGVTLILATIACGGADRILPPTITLVRPPTDTPRPTDTPPPTHTVRPRPDPVQTIHIVQPGETLSEIAKQWRVIGRAHRGQRHRQSPPHQDRPGAHHSRHRQRTRGVPGEVGPVRHATPRYPRKMRHSCNRDNPPKGRECPLLLVFRGKNHPFPPASWRCSTWLRSIEPDADTAALSGSADNGTT